MVAIDEKAEEAHTVSLDFSTRLCERPAVIQRSSSYSQFLSSLHTSVS